MALYWQVPVNHTRDFQLESQGITREFEKKKEKRKKLTRQDKHVPLKQRRIKLHQKYRNTRPPDHRFSDQRKLRRMYRNS